MSRSKRNWDALINEKGNYYNPNIGSGSGSGAKGEKGVKGEGATVAVGNTSVVPAVSAAVTNSGSNQAATFNFALPKGEKGETEVSAATVGAHAKFKGNTPNRVLAANEIYGNYNVSGIEKTDSGKWTITFATPFSDADYSVVATLGYPGINRSSGFCVVVVSQTTTSMVLLAESALTGNQTDVMDHIYFVIYGSGTAAANITYDHILEGNTKIEAVDSGVDGHIEFTTEGAKRWDMTTAGHIIPDGNALYDIGEAGNKVRHLYLSDNSLKFVKGDNSEWPLSVSGNELMFNGEAVGGDSSLTWTVTASGTTNYIFAGPGFAGSEEDPVLYVSRGQKYKISNTMGAHPFQIQSTAGIGGAAYSDGITNNAVSNGVLEWEVRMDAPNTLYYQCTAHAAMGGTINVR